MEITIKAEVENGMDNLLKILGTLRRKNFRVVEIELKKTDGPDLVAIRMEADTERLAMTAGGHLQKIIGVSNVRVLEKMM